MSWSPIAEAGIRDELNSSWSRMSLPQQRLWQAIRITPEKWVQEPWGNEGGGFWVVAIYGKSVIWYNDIEDGFNRSTYETYGRFIEYRCNQDQLEWTLENVLDEIRDGAPSGWYLGQPEPIAEHSAPSRK